MVLYGTTLGTTGNSEMTLRRLSRKCDGCKTYGSLRALSLITSTLRSAQLDCDK